MQKKGWILLLLLLGVAVLVSCGKKEGAVTEKGELVRAEAWEEMIDLPGLRWYNLTIVVLPQ